MNLHEWNDSIADFYDDGFGFNHKICKRLDCSLPVTFVDDVALKLNTYRFMLSISSLAH